MKAQRPLIVGIGGTLRQNSTSERALRLALDFAFDAGCSTEIFAGAAVNLPPYDPADSQPSAGAKALVEALRRADGVILSSPSYHGSVPGLLKNALDYVEEMRADGRVYLSDRSVGIIVCADGIQAMGSTVSTLRSIAHALRAWPTPYAAAINSGKPFAADGACLIAEVEQSVRLVAAQVVEFAQMRIAADQNAVASASHETTRLVAAELAAGSAEWGEMVGASHFDVARNRRQARN